MLAGAENLPKVGCLWAAKQEPDLSLRKVHPPEVGSCVRKNPREPTVTALRALGTA